MATILELILKGKDAGAGAAVKGLDKALGGLRTILGGLGLGIGTAEMIRFGQASIAAARESAAAEAELQAALTSTGQATAEYKAQLEGLATQLENTSLFTDEQVQQAEATLVTFRNLGQDVMPRTIQVVADMGQKMGNLGSAAELAGKLLNVPEQAAARMQRQGIMLTQQQKEQIAAMVEMGNVAGAQAVVLDALEVKFGGQAQAARDAAGGAQDYAVSVGRLQEAMGLLLLTIGDAGATDAAVGWIDRLAAGASAWSSAIENIQLLTEANQRLTQELTLVEQAEQGAIGQVDRSNNAYKAAESALASLIGWFVEGATEQEGFAQAVQDAAQATNDAATVIAGTPAKLHPAQQAVKAYADSIRDLTQAQLANQAETQAGAFGGQQDAFTQNLNLTQLQQASDARLAAQAEKEKQQEEADKKQLAQAKASAQAMGDAVKDATKDLATDISSAVSDAVTGVDQNVIGDLLGLDNADANAGEAVRRMAAVAAGGIQNEWAPALAAQLTGVKDATAQAFVTAFQSGDDSKLKATAQQLALNPIVELFDAQLIANQVEQKLRAGQLQQALNDKVNALLGEKGLPAIQSVTQQVGTAVTTTGDAVNTVGTNVAGVATTAETAMGKVSESLTGTLVSIDTVILRIGLLNKALERTKVLAGEAGAAIGGLNPPAPGASLVPNGAQMKMGGSTPQ